MTHFLSAITAAERQAPDSIIIKGLHANTVVGLDAWQRPQRKQPLIADFRVYFDVTAAAKADDVRGTINYGTLSKVLIDVLERGHYDDLYMLAWDVQRLVKQHAGQITRGQAIKITLPKGLLLAEGVGIMGRIESPAIDDRSMYDTFFIDRLTLPVIIGVNAHERVSKQHVFISARLESPDNKFYKNYVERAAALVSLVEKTRYLTLETLATVIAKYFCVTCEVDIATVTVEKPSAIALVDTACVEITRTRLDFS